MARSIASLNYSMGMELRSSQTNQCISALGERVKLREKANASIQTAMFTKVSSSKEWRMERVSAR